MIRKGMMILGVLCVLGLAGAVWGTYNVGYIVLVSFAPEFFVSRGYPFTEASWVVSLVGWLLIPTIPASGFLAERLHHTDAVIAAAKRVPISVKFLVSLGRHFSAAENAPSLEAALAHRPDIEVLATYLPTFEDPNAGEVAAQQFINDGADVVFAAAGASGNGALVAAAGADVMAIGVDVDQYHTVHEAAPALLTSASKLMDVAAADAVRGFLAGELEAGIRMAHLANGGVGLAPYHDWEDRIPDHCRQAVEEAHDQVIADPSISGGA